MLKFAPLLLLSVALSGTAVAAGDVAVGKAKVDQVCSKCHAKEDWADESTASMESKINDVVSGKFKHKIPVKLTGEEIAGIAAYWTAK
jgi:cytochrome c553